MNSVMVTLHPVTNAAWDVLRTPAMLVQADANRNDDAASQGKASALPLILDRAPKTGDKLRYVTTP